MVGKEGVKMTDNSARVVSGLFIHHAEFIDCQSQGCRHTHHGIANTGQYDRRTFQVNAVPDHIFIIAHINLPTGFRGCTF